MPKYENLPDAEYAKARSIFQAEGRAIPDGAQVEPTEWAYQNGVIKRADGRFHYFKVRNCEDPEMIAVKKLETQQSSKYWAGFWKETPTLHI